MTPPTLGLDRERVRPRQVFCPIEAERRDLAVAADVLAGRHHHAGRTLDLGPDPDWDPAGALATLVDDEEWHIEWSKFYVGLDLAHAYATTGDAAYLHAWRRLVLSWVEQRRPDSDSSDVTARRVQNWLYAWQSFDRVPGFPGLDPAFEETLLASTAAQLAHVRATLTPERNHRTLELYGLLVLALGLPVLDPDGSSAAEAWSLLCDNLLTDVWSDGVHRERSTHYHLIALRSFVAARVNVVRFGGEVPAAYDERLRAACRFAVHLHRPDGRIPALSDSDSGSYLDLLALAAETVDVPGARWVATRGREGTPPPDRCADFPVAGYHVQRSGWGERGGFGDERFLVLGCGPLGDGGHGHYDALSVEAYAHGHPLVVDPGRYTYAEGDPNWRHWFKGTAAHNTVTVDGLDQQPYRRGKPKGPQVRARLLERRSVEGPGGADGGLHLLRAEVTSPAYDTVHRRTVVMVAGEYWLVHDELRAPTPHAYSLRWHLADEVAPTVDVVTGVSRVRTPTVSIEVAGGGVAEVEPGWVSVEYGVRTPAPVVAVPGPTGAADADLLTLLAPRTVAGAATLVRADATAATAVVTSPDGSTDHVAWGGPARTVVAGGLLVSAETVWLRVDAAGTLLRVALQRPTTARWTGPGPGPVLARRGEWHVWGSGTGPA